MTTIHLLTAEHFSIPARRVEAFATAASADAAAWAIVKELVADTVARSCFADEISETVVVMTSWRDQAKWLENYYGAAHCFVQVDEIELQP